MRDLLAREAADVRAAEAVALFCYQAKKWVARSPPRSADWTRSCSRRDRRKRAADPRPHLRGLDFLGIELDDAQCGARPVISTDASRVTVRVMRTDEELMIARSVSRVLRLNPTQER